MKSSASESSSSKGVLKAKFPAKPGEKKGFLIDSDAEPFMYLIQSIRFGS